MYVDTMYVGGEIQGIMMQRTRNQGVNADEGRWGDEEREWSM